MAIYVTLQPRFCITSFRCSLFEVEFFGTFFGWQDTNIHTHTHCFIQTYCKFSPPTLQSSLKLQDTKPQGLTHPQREMEAQTCSHFRWHTSFLSFYFILNGLYGTLFVSSIELLSHLIIMRSSWVKEFWIFRVNFFCVTQSSWKLHWFFESHVPWKIKTFTFPPLSSSLFPESPYMVITKIRRQNSLFEFSLHWNHSEETCN